jgi:thioredoxin-related protein
MKALLLAGLMLITGLAQADTEYHPQNLDDASQLPTDKPVVMITEISNCPYCERIKREFLGPLSVSTDFGPNITIVSINLESRASMLDFSGNKTTQDDWAMNMKVDFSPTVLVLHPVTGERLAEDIVGLATPDFYGFYLERNILRGLQALGHD